MIAALIIGVYVLVALGIYIMPAFIPTLNEKFNGRTAPSIEMFALLWMFVGPLWFFIMLMNGLATWRNNLLERSIERQTQKKLQYYDQEIKKLDEMKIAKQLRQSNYNDIVIENNPVNYRHANCKHCGKLL